MNHYYMDFKNVQVKDEEYIKKNGGIIYDKSEGSGNLPDVKKLVLEINAVLEYMTNKEMLEIKKNNVEKYEDIIEQRFPDFVDKNYGIFKKFVDSADNDINPLINMLKEIDKVNKGYKTLEKAEKKLGNELADKFINPIIKKK
jgi:hypothetical protein